MQGKGFDQIRNALWMHPYSKDLLGFTVTASILLGVSHGIADQHLIWLDQAVKRLFILWSHLANIKQR